MSRVNGLRAPKPWSLGHGWEQGDPGWYIYADRGGVVLVLDDDVPLTRPEAEMVLAALMRIGWPNPLRVEVGVVPITIEMRREDGTPIDLTTPIVRCSVCSRLLEVLDAKQGMIQACPRGHFGATLTTEFATDRHAHSAAKLKVPR